MLTGDRIAGCGRRHGRIVVGGSVEKVAFAILGAVFVSATPVSAAVTYTYTSTRLAGGPDISFTYTSASFINTRVELSYASLAPSGVTTFDYVDFCPAGSLCGGAGSYQFTATGDEIYLINLHEPNSGPPPPIVLPDGTVFYPPAVVTAVSQDAAYVAGTFDTLGSFRATTNTAYLTISDGSAVPEPASWAMMVGGFGILGGAMRRRKAKVSFA